ncbi:hypothetical protein [Alicyclobacillus fastidiosus]|uniref:Major facilitator superfamily (MFS) profile domain-containing protein n=1 Tax=Alicyclobacillus fastidiosus TaxID=392011 RepID=A0ABV5ACJ7_9BACL|nr:hypothetical protein [Alicyclobacillus fastidiosus]WEH11375.1 hypothetical protein PYS47_09255 [Alicyclobacillus fastidiosus]
MSHKTSLCPISYVVDYIEADEEGDNDESKSIGICFDTRCVFSPGSIHHRYVFTVISSDCPTIWLEGFFRTTEYVSGTPFIYQKIYGASPQLFAMLFATNGISLILGSQMVGRLSHMISERRFLLFGLLLSGLTSSVVLLVVLFHGPLFALVIPLFFFVASIGITSTASFPLAMKSQGHIAGSASAILGLLPFLFGAVTSPLVGIQGEYSATPLGVILLSASLLALLVYFFLIRKPTIRPGIERCPATLSETAGES